MFERKTTMTISKLFLTLILTTLGLYSLPSGASEKNQKEEKCWSTQTSDNTIGKCREGRIVKDVMGNKGPFCGIKGATPESGTYANYFYLDKKCTNPHPSSQTPPSVTGIKTKQLDDASGTPQSVKDNSTSTTPAH